MDLTVQSVSDKMLEMIDKIKEKLTLLDKAAQEKADTIGEYEKALAIRIMELKSKGDIAITVIEKVARGDCYQQRINMELAESNYKSLLTKIESAKAILNGYQSINRYLEDLNK